MRRLHNQLLISARSHYRARTAHLPDLTAFCAPSFACSRRYTILRIAEAGGELRISAIASIVISALTTGFGAATIGFDLDVDPRRRSGEPDFYGYVPDSAIRRTLLFGCMIAIGALLLLVRSMSTAVLALLDRRYVAYYYVCDMGLYLGYKLSRHDFWHWFPGSELHSQLYSQLPVRSSYFSLIFLRSFVFPGLFRLRL